MKHVMLPLLAFAVSACSGAADIRRAKDIVSLDLRDPSSAEWEDVAAYQLPNEADATPPRMTPGGLAVCGRVNARNLFGGYTGFRRFVVDMESGQAWLDPRHRDGRGDGAAADYEGVTFDLVVMVACSASNRR